MFRRLIQISAPIVLGGCGYAYYRHDQSQQFLRYQEKFVKKNGYGTLATSISNTKSARKGTFDALSQHKATQQQLIEKIAPFQRQLVEVNRTIDANNTQLGVLNGQVSQIKDELNQARLFENKLFELKKQELQRQAEIDLQKLNNVEHEAYLAKCAENAKAIANDSNNKMQSEKKNIYLAGGLLEQINEN